MADKQHLYLVDGSAYIFRAYHRLPPLTNPEGTPVGAVYGYTTMLWKLADDLDKAEGPTHLAVILDKSQPQLPQRDLRPNTRPTGPTRPKTCVPQFPLIRDATRAFSLPCIEEAGLEADDLIATYARAAHAQGLGRDHRLFGQGPDAAGRQCAERAGRRGQAAASTCSTR